MGQNASFIEEIYEKVKSSAEYRAHHAGKKIIIVFDNAQRTARPNMCCG